MTSRWSDWPALDLQGQPVPTSLSYRRGVWGKVPGAVTDYRWIAASRDFLPRHEGLERELNLGTEDEPRRAFFWRGTGDGGGFAVTCYPSRARDRESRGSFLEKQVLAWSAGGLPAALGALLLLPRTAGWTDEVWWEEREDERFGDPGFVLELGEEVAPPVAVLDSELDAAVESGIDELERLLGPRGLAELYATLASGGRPVPVDVSDEPLPPLALAALLLPLPRPQSDRLSLTGGLPSGRFDVARLAQSWDVLAGMSSRSHLDEAAVAGCTADAERLAGALLARRPEDLAPRVTISADPPPREKKPIHIALWGPAAAGKTVLIAQLYIHHGESQNGLGWSVFLDKSSLQFILQMRERMHLRNHFPVATSVGVVEPIVYTFKNEETGVEASMVVEDRAGADFENLHEEAQERLRSADGLVLLFDPTREPLRLEYEIARTLDEVSVSRGRSEKDPRPIAVCVSKADVLVKNVADYEQAIRADEDFVRRSVHKELVATVKRLCARPKFFPMSAAGVRMSHGVIEPNVFYDETLTPRIRRGGTPLNLLAPFAWVLDEVTR